ncbi:MAG: hypothetical protein AB7O54_11245 [Pseudomonadales bacterium]
MARIEVDSDTHQRLELVAHVAGISVAEVIRRLVREQRYPGSSDSEGFGWVPIYAKYYDRLFDGEFEPLTGRVRVTSGELAGKEYPAPSPAAIAVVREVNPKRTKPHTNGWRFWRDKQSDKTLESQFDRPHR